MIKFKIGDIVKFKKDFTHPNTGPNPKDCIGNIYKATRIDREYLYILNELDGWFKERFEIATLEEIVKAKLLGKYFE